MVAKSQYTSVDKVFGPSLLRLKIWEWKKFDGLSSCLEDIGLKSKTHHVQLNSTGAVTMSNQDKLLSTFYTKVQIIRQYREEHSELLASH